MGTALKSSIRIDTYTSSSILCKALVIFKHRLCEQVISKLSIVVFTKRECLMEEVVGGGETIGCSPMPATDCLLLPGVVTLMVGACHPHPSTLSLVRASAQHQSTLRGLMGLPVLYSLPESFHSKLCNYVFPSLKIPSDSIQVPHPVSVSLVLL